MTTIDYDIERGNSSFTIKVTGYVTPYLPASYEDPAEGGELEIEDITLLPGEEAPAGWDEEELTDKEEEGIRTAIYEAEEANYEPDYRPAIDDCGCAPGDYCHCCYGNGTH